MDSSHNRWLPCCHRETDEHALQYFERAMDRALRMENLPGEGSQLRLSARLARDLLEGRQPEPNPFATLDHEQTVPVG